MFRKEIKGVCPLSQKGTPLEEPPSGGAEEICEPPRAGVPRHPAWGTNGFVCSRNAVEWLAGKHVKETSGQHLDPDLYGKGNLSLLQTGVAPSRGLPGPSVLHSPMRSLSIARSRKWRAPPQLTVLVGQGCLWRELVSPSSYSPSPLCLLLWWLLTVLCLFYSPC